MTLFEILLDPGLLPFEIAVGVVLGLLILEIVVNQIGFSLLGSSEPGFDGDAEIDFDGDFDLDAEAVEFDGLAAEDAIDFEPEADAPEAVAGGGALSWLGFGKVPFTIWMTGILTAFGLSGYVIQLIANALFGAPLGPLVASALALPPALVLGGRFARAIGALFPKTKTSAISRRSYSRRRGVITVGTATHDNPAQARFADGHGNWHYAQVVPFDAKESLPQGTEVMILRSRDGTLRAIRIG